MEKNTDKPFAGEFTAKSETERILEAGIHGAPELRHDEKTHYLGEFRERVIRLLTKRQVAEPLIYREIEEALKDRRAALMVMDSQLSNDAAGKYRKLAAACGKPVTDRHDADFAGDTGLVVVSREAVDVETVTVEDRTERLLAKGLPENLILAAGKSICKDCYEKLREAAPEEAEHYKVISAFSRFLGDRCAAHE